MGYLKNISIDRSTFSFSFARALQLFRLHSAAVPASSTGEPGAVLLAERHFGRAGKVFFLIICLLLLLSLFELSTESLYRSIDLTSFNSLL